MSVKKYGIEDHSDQPVTNAAKKLLIPRQFADQVTVLVAEDSSVEYASKIDMVWTFGKLSKIRIGGAHHVSFSYYLKIKYHVFSKTTFPFFSRFGLLQLFNMPKPYWPRSDWTIDLVGKRKGISKRKRLFG